MTEDFIPNKIKRDILASENIYTTQNCCIFKISDKNNKKKILKISIYNKDEYDLLTLLKQSDNKYLLKPELLQKKNGLIYAIYPCKKPLLEIIEAGTFSFNDLLNLSFNLCSGIIFLHEKKYLHLDISPDNIYLNDDNSFCIGDYSSARKLRKKIRGNNLYLTPGYSPPEFTALPKNNIFINELSDEYSLAKTILSIFEMNDTDDSQKEIQKEFCQILKKAGSEIQEFRYPSMLEFKNALSEFEKQYKSDIINFEFNIDTLDKSFDSLKTLPLYKEPQKLNHETLFAFINTPFFMTLTIILAILLPAITLYNIFFIPHISTLPPAETAPITTYISTEHNNNITRNTAAVITSSPDILSLVEFDVKQHVIKKISTDTFKKIAGKTLDNGSLKILSANNNLINDISGITSFYNIEELYISCNKIKNINALSNLKHLKTLVISSNLIEDIYALSEIKTLENLDLSYNKKLKNIMPLTKLKSLKLLCVSETNISKKDINKLKKTLPDCEIIY